VRRLLALVSAVVFVETAFYSVITPLLPELSAEFALSKAQAGVLAACYGAGTLAGSIPGGWLVARAGVRPTLQAGLGLMVVSSVVFAFAGSVLVLDAARLLQGVGAAACWTGGLGWLVRAVPPARRGAAIGTAMGMATVGGLFGPVLGGLASAIGIEPVFCGVAALGVGVMAWAATADAPRPEGESHLGVLLAALREPAVLLGLWLMLIPGLLYGTIYVLTPLRLDALGAGATAIAAVFLGASALEAVVSPLSGRLTDRLGRAIPAAAGLTAGALTMLALPWPGTAWLLAGAIVIGAPLIGFLWTPSITLVSDGADTLGVEPGFVFALTNLAWALGQSAGSAGSASLAQAAGDRLPYLLLAGMCLGTLALLRRAGPVRRAAMDAAPRPASLSRP
jgi:predicted MFS family arabinose efflux permease